MSVNSGFCRFSRTDCLKPVGVSSKMSLLKVDVDVGIPPALLLIPRNTTTPRSAVRPKPSISDILRSSNTSEINPSVVSPNLIDVVDVIFRKSSRYIKPCTPMGEKSFSIEGEGDISSRASGSNVPDLDSVACDFYSCEQTSFRVVVPNTSKFALHCHGDAYSNGTSPMVSQK